MVFRVRVDGRFGSVLVDVRSLVDVGFDGGKKAARLRRWLLPSALGYNLIGQRRVRATLRGGYRAKPTTTASGLRRDCGSPRPKELFFLKSIHVLLVTRTLCLGRPLLLVRRSY